MTAYKRYGNVVRRYTLFDTLSTTVDENSASGQAVLKVASTTGFAVGDVVEVDSAAATERELQAELNKLLAEPLDDELDK
jgi:hypothetical protein